MDVFQLPRCRRFGAASLVLTCGLLLGVASAQPRSRTLTGTVTDRGHEPLKGAVVEVQNEVSGTVVSFITTRDGQYSFKRLDGNVDYKVWATFRGHQSKHMEMSHFDSKLEKVIDLTVNLDD